MPATLKVVDHHFGSSAPAREAGRQLRLASERTTAREIIRSRVATEIDELIRKQDDQGPRRSYIVAFEPHASEVMLHETPSAPVRKIERPDLEAEVARAIAQFSSRRFIMLLDDRQIEDLDAAVGLRPDSEIVFVHLMPLKGG
jgi:hypothetical protein